MFGPLRPGDERLADELAGRLLELLTALRPTQVCCPAGIGWHIDHVITRSATTSAARASGFGAPLYYKEMPYATTKRGAAQVRLIEDSSVPLVCPATEQDWHRKLTAIQAYRSQLPTLWRDCHWATALAAHAAAITNGGRGERLWLACD
jgi:LmbE family N-acetylglucosaminyl deacetylase